MAMTESEIEREKDEEEGGEVVAREEDCTVFEAKPSSLCDLGDDSLSSVVSFLSPTDVMTCARVCRHLRSFCKDDEKVWLPMCERRWGARTCVQRWGRRKVAFKVLHSQLSKLENLIGFWRGVGNRGGHGSLVIFEWGPYFVTGFRVTPSRPSSYGVCKVPFVWIGVSDEGRSVCFFDPSETNVVGDFSNVSPSCSTQGSSVGELPEQLERIRGVRKVDPFADFSPDLDLEQLSSIDGLAVVDLHFVGNSHIVIEELPQNQFLGSRILTGAGVVASFGSSGNLAAAAAVAAGIVTSPESDRSGQSPPGSLQYEMYQFLSSKVTSQGGDRAARRQRRREKVRAFMQGRRSCEPEHFVKVMDFGPTPARPLQGLWKGICDSTGLDFLQLFYDEQGGIVCRRLGECLGTTHSGSVCWTAKLDSLIHAPLPDVEQDMLIGRQHILPKFDTDMMGPLGMTKEFDEEVVGMLYTDPIMGFELAMVSEGRVWQYASGRFGFGSLPNNFIIDFRPICSPSGLLLDVYQ